MISELIRCPWALQHPLETLYHDHEWGVPLHEDNKLFELLILEGAQAGLSWLTVLKKRENYRQSFKSFFPENVACFNADEITALMNDAGLIRNRLKLEAAVANARAFLDVQKEHGSFNKFIWQFVSGQPIQNAWTEVEQVPAQTAQSQAMSKALKKRGFKFVGPTICYAFMQATGMVNDHLTTCFRHAQLRAKR